MMLGTNFKNKVMPFVLKEVVLQVAGTSILTDLTY